MKRTLANICMLALVGLAGACGQPDEVPDNLAAAGYEASDLRDAKRIDAGTVLDNVTEPYSDVIDSDPVVTADAAYKVALATSEYLETRDGLVAAPPGGTFFVYSVHRSDHPDGAWKGDPTASTKARTSTVDLTVDGKTYPVDTPQDSNYREFSAVAVNGAGNDAQFGITYDGRTQHLDAQGKRNAEETPGFYVDLPTGAGEEVTVKVGSDAPDAIEASAKLWEIELRTSAHDPQKGWAPEGKVWAEVTGLAAEEQHPLHHNTAGETTDYIGNEFRITNASLDGVAATASHLNRQGPLADVRLLFEVPFRHDTTTRNLSLTINSSGRPNHLLKEKGSPESVDVDYTFDAPIRLEPRS